MEVCQGVNGDCTPLTSITLKGSMDLDEDEMMCLTLAFNTEALLFLKPGTLSQWFKILITTLDSLLLLLALLGNSATLLVLYRIRGQSGRLGCFLGSLVMSDLLTVLFMVTFDLPYLWHDNFTWVLGGTMCKAAAFLQAVVILTNSTTLITIAVDRYISIVYPHHTPPCLAWRKWHVLAFLCGLFFLSCGVSAPYLFYYHLEGPHVGYSKVGNGSFDHFTCPEYFCWSSESVHRFEVWLTCIVFLPLLVTFCVCYSSLILFLHTRPTVGRADQKQLVRKRKVLLTLACVVITFLVFRLPSWVLLLLAQPISPTEFDRRLAFSYAHYSLHTLSLCAPAFNPFLYTLVHETYRQHLPAPLVKVLGGQPSTKVFPVHDTTFTQPTPATCTTSLDTHSYIKPHHTHTHTLPCSTSPTQPSATTVTTSPDACTTPQPHHTHTLPSPTFHPLTLTDHLQERATAHQKTQDLPGLLMVSS